MPSLFELARQTDVRGCQKRTCGAGSPVRVWLVLLGLLLSQAFSQALAQGTDKGDLKGAAAVSHGDFPRRNQEGWAAAFGATQYLSPKIRRDKDGTLLQGPPMAVPPPLWPVSTLAPTATKRLTDLERQAVTDIIEEAGIRPPQSQYPLTGAQFARIMAASAILGDKLAKMPERNAHLAREQLNVQNQQNADTNAGCERHQAACAIDFCRARLENFTVEDTNQWNKVRNELFVPMAILLLLPGAILCQVKATIAQGFSVFGEMSPFEGIQRSIVAIFLIPGSMLVINYGIDFSNAVTACISSEYNHAFPGSNMYQDAMAAHIRAFGVRDLQSERNHTPQQPANMEAPVGKAPTTPFGKWTQRNVMVRLQDPVAKLDITPADRAREQVPYVVNAQRASFNGINAALATTWNILCAFQEAYLYYLWFVGPVVAALWVWPMKQLREAFPSWCEGVITLCFWSLFWHTVILLMACFRGVEGETLLMTALNFLATACVKAAFDFAGLVKAAGQDAARAAEKAFQSGKKPGPSPKADDKPSGPPAPAPAPDPAGSAGKTGGAPVASPFAGSMPAATGSASTHLPSQAKNRAGELLARLDLASQGAGAVALPPAYAAAGADPAKSGVVASKLSGQTAVESVGDPFAGAVSTRPSARVVEIAPPPASKPSGAAPQRTGTSPASVSGLEAVPPVADAGAGLGTGSRSAVPHSVLPFGTSNAGVGPVRGPLIIDSELFGAPAGSGKESTASAGNLRLPVKPISASGDGALAFKSFLAVPTRAALGSASGGLEPASATGAQSGLPVSHLFNLQATGDSRLLGDGKTVALNQPAAPEPNSKTLAAPSQPVAPGAVSPAAFDAGLSNTRARMTAAANPLSDGIAGGVPAQAGVGADTFTTGYAGRKVASGITGGDKGVQAQSQPEARLTATGIAYGALTGGNGPDGGLSASQPAANRLASVESSTAGLHERAAIPVVAPAAPAGVGLPPAYKPASDTPQQSVSWSPAAAVASEALLGAAGGGSMDRTVAAQMHARWSPGAEAGSPGGTKSGSSSSAPETTAPPLTQQYFLREVVGESLPPSSAPSTVASPEPSYARASVDAGFCTQLESPSTTDALGNGAGEQPRAQGQRISHARAVVNESPAPVSAQGSIPPASQSKKAAVSSGCDAMGSLPHDRDLVASAQQSSNTESLHTVLSKLMVASRARVKAATGPDEEELAALQKLGRQVPPPAQRRESMIAGE